MSAILFTQEQSQPQAQLVALDSQDTPTQANCSENANPNPTIPSSTAEIEDRSNRNIAAAPHQPVDICEELLGSKMAALALNAEPSMLMEQRHDGSDSGLDIMTVTTTVTTDNDTGELISLGCMQQLQRALSSNSGGYASSSGGLDDNTAATNITSATNVSSSALGGLNMSGNSSLISCSSDLCELKVGVPQQGVGSSDAGGSGSGSGSGSLSLGHCTAGLSRTVLSYECCSENGSESSAVMCASASAASIRRSNSVKKKVALFEPARDGFATPMSRSVRERVDCGTPTSSTIVVAAIPAPVARVQRVSSVKRTTSLSRNSSTASASNSAAINVRERFVEKQSGRSSVSSTTPNTPFRATPVPRSSKPQKPDSLPNALNRNQSMSMQRLVQRTPSLSRARTPCTPSDDGRWPGNSRAMSVAVNSKRGLSVTPDLLSLKARTSHMASSVMEMKCSSSHNPYSTLPRRRKQKSVEDLTAAHDSRSSSITRDSRMTSSVMLSSSSNTRKSLVNAFGNVSSTATPQSSQARMRRMQPPKTRIYHETSVQTALTSDDLEKMFAGGTPATRPIDAVDQRDCNTQTDIRDVELERLRDEVRQLAQREHELSVKLQREREEKLIIQRELHVNTERVMNMLELARVTGHSGGEAATPTSDDGSGHDSLLMLESQIQMSGHELIERQQEIGQLRQLCRTLQLEMERSLAAQECLLQEKVTIEQESNELQDFLQHEKAALCDALKELESEHQNCKQQLTNREEEVKVLRDECRHLVRLNEQRRQENRLLQTKYVALENKSKEMMMQQNYSVSGASAALAGLHSRLDSLVEQLVSTYNITEHDLEDIGFQNETQTNGGNGDAATHDCSDQQQQQSAKSNSANGLELCMQQPQPHHHHQCLPSSSDGSLSPQRNQSFIAAVISAIRNATTPGGKKLLARNGKRIGANGTGGGNAHSNGNGSGNGHGHGHGHGHGNQMPNANYNNYNGETHNGDDSDSTEMLDSETEPCLMMDNVLEDVTMPDSHSHNMVSSCAAMISQTEIPSELINVATGDESLHNLSQAISNRQQMELQISAMNVQKVSNQLNQCENSNSDDISCHDSVAEMPSLMEYCTAQAVVDQVIEVDSLITKLLKVLRLIQMDNDNCIQQLIVDKNKLQENKEDMLEKLKDLEVVNMKLQDELMDATQELMLKNNDLSNTKAEMQRHRNEIDRLTQDICNLSTLCSNYKKLSPTVEISPMQQQLLMATPTLLTHSNGATNPSNSDVPDNLENDAASIINLLKMWQSEGQLKHSKVRKYLMALLNGGKDGQEYNERLRIYANQLENVLKVLEDCGDLMQDCAALQQLRHDIEVVKTNANWTSVISDAEVNCNTSSDTNSSNRGEQHTNGGRPELTAYVIEDLNANEQSQQTIVN